MTRDIRLAVLKAATSVGTKAIWRLAVYVCIEDGCNNGRESGHALQRVSPKGQSFEGVCEDHAAKYGVVVEPIALLIQDANHRRDRAR